MTFSEEKLKELLTLGYDKAIASHLREVVAFYSYLFNEPDPCINCPSKLKGYWDKLQQSGIYLIQNKKTMKNQSSKFKIKEGIKFLQMDFGSSVFFNNETITDELAIEYLKKNPNRIVNFSTYPENWKSLIGVKEEEKILLFEKELTLAEAIEAFKNSDIKTSAKTANGLLEAFGKATDEEKESLKAVVLG